MKKIIVITAIFLFGSFLSCKKSFLDQQPIGSFSENVLHNGKGVQKLLVGAYSLLNGKEGLTTAPGQVLFGSIRGGEAHKGSSVNDQNQMVEIQKFQVLPGNPSISEPFQYFFNGVNRANLVLKYLTTVKDLNDQQKNQIAAEARFLRGHYYFMLKRLWKNLPWIDETVNDVRVPNTDAGGNYIDIWPKIKADFDFARKNLSVTNSEVGPPNKWAAEAYYAKVLIYMGNEGADTYAEALTVLNDVIANGITNQGVKYALLPNYHDNWNAAMENGPEWVWGVQHSVNDGTSGDNTNGSSDIEFISPSEAPGGPTSGFGFFNPSQFFVDHFRVDNNGLPYLDGYATNPNSIKSDDGLESADPFTIDINPVDPRLDWSVARRGIPFLDYGIFPGKSWIREQSSAGPYMSKKFFTLNKDLGKYTIVGQPQNAINIPFIRYADVLLFAAEMEARIGSLDAARNYINQVRNRMVQNSSSPDNWVKSNDGVTNAANYKIGLYPAGSTAFTDKASTLKTILFERLLELGEEGHRGYDLVRFGAADGLTDVQEFNAFIAFESKRKSYLAGGVYTKLPDMWIPIPQVAIDNSQVNGKPTLKQNPGY